MKIIGVTGGVGCGKSEVLDYIKDNYKAIVLKADELAASLKEPGGVCYQPLVDLLGEEILEETAMHRIDNRKMAAKIFADEALLSEVNAIVHPAVKQEILLRIERAKSEKKADYFFLEAALLLEEGYDKLVDEMWYVYAPESVRAERLMRGRGYTSEKTESIMQKQLSEKAFRQRCSVVIDNGGRFSETAAQIRGLLHSEDEEQK